jgi:hypothetical protein
MMELYLAGTESGVGWALLGHLVVKRVEILLALDIYTYQIAKRLVLYKTKKLLDCLG